MKKIIVTQSNYIPWKGYFDMINFADEFILYDEVQYTRRDWRNRNKIKTPNGTLWLTIPVDVKGKYLQKIKDTRVMTDENWRETHWKTILMNYAHAPHFKTYKDAFEPLYRDTSEVYLSMINYTFLETVNKILGITTPMRWSYEIPKNTTDRNERLIELCKAFGATDFYNGPTSKGYMDEELFRKNGINAHYLNYSGYKPYNQMYGEFDPAVSVLDLIFNEGPNATKYMKSFSGKPDSMITPL